MFKYIVAVPFSNPLKATTIFVTSSYHLNAYPLNLLFLLGNFVKLIPISLRLKYFLKIVPRCLYFNAVQDKAIN